MSRLIAGGIDYLFVVFIV